jgi:hypothetical protein
VYYASKAAAVNQRVIASAVVTAVFLTSNAAAHPLTREECTEGSDFIKNAALSRENGMDGMTFLAQTIADLAAIKSFPPALRWFVQDQHDEDYLLAAVAEVFSHPREPQLHQRSFFGECITRTTARE